MIHIGCSFIVFIISCFLSYIVRKNKYSSLTRWSVYTSEFPISIHSLLLKSILFLPEMFCRYRWFKDCLEFSLWRETCSLKFIQNLLEILAYNEIQMKSGFYKKRWGKKDHPKVKPNKQTNTNKNKTNDVYFL